MLIGGVFTTYSGSNFNRIIRLNSDGYIDTSFSVGSAFNSTTRTIDIQSDNKILIAGEFTSYSGVSKNEVIRLNTDGSIDNSFSIGVGFDNDVIASSIQSDGKILFGGNFTSYSGVSTPGLIRLNTNGYIDTTFNNGTGLGFGASVIKLQSDGKILVGGSFTSYSGVPKNNIVRLNTDGYIDTTFNIGNGFTFGGPTCIETQSDGKILVGGDFLFYSGVSKNRIIRLNTDGSIDNSFIIGTGFNISVFEIKQQADGKILVIGGFTTYQGISCNGIVRLNSDGSRDTSFNMGTGFNSTAKAISIEILQNGKILVGGSFTEYNGEIENYIVTLNSDGTIFST